MRILVYTGKGGVGKTSVAAATALRCASLGHKTLVLSTDAAHSLGDSLGIELRAEPVPVLPNLWAQEINALHELEQNWRVVGDFLSQVLAWQGVESIAREELTVIPGTEELFSLLQIKRHHDSGVFDVLVVDAAPTGETLRLLSLPDVFRWWLHRLFPAVRGVLKVIRPLVSRVSDIPVASDEVMGSVQTVIDELIAVRNLLNDGNHCTARIVLNLEKMVIREAQRSLTYLNLFGYSVDAILVNRVYFNLNGQEELPETGSRFASWAAMQAGYWPEVQRLFAPLPILTAPFFEKEVVGQARLEKLAQALYGDSDPTAFLYKGPAQRIEEVSGGYTLHLPLAFVNEGDIHLQQHQEELTIEVGWYRQHLVLPQSLARMQAVEAYMENGELLVHFERY